MQNPVTDVAPGSLSRVNESLHPARLGWVLNHETHLPHPIKAVASSFISCTGSGAPVPGRARRRCSNPVEAPESILGMVRLVEAVLKQGKWASPPLSRLETKSVVSSAPATPGLRPRGISTTVGGANFRVGSAASTGSAPCPPTTRESSRPGHGRPYAIDSAENYDVDRLDACSSFK